LRKPYRTLNDLRKNITNYFTGDNVKTSSTNGGLERHGLGHITFTIPRMSDIYGAVLSRIPRIQFSQPPSINDRNTIDTTQPSTTAWDQGSSTKDTSNQPYIMNSRLARRAFGEIDVDSSTGGANKASNNDVVDEENNEVGETEMNGFLKFGGTGGRNRNHGRSRTDAVNRFGKNDVSGIIGGTGGGIRMGDSVRSHFPGASGVPYVPGISGGKDTMDKSVTFGMAGDSIGFGERSRQDSINRLGEFDISDGDNRAGKRGISNKKFFKREIGEIKNESEGGRIGDANKFGRIGKDSRVSGGFQSDVMDKFNNIGGPGEEGGMNFQSETGSKINKRRKNGINGYVKFDGADRGNDENRERSKSDVINRFGGGNSEGTCRRGRSSGMSFGSESSRTNIESGDGRKGGSFKFSGNEGGGGNRMNSFGQFGVANRRGGPNNGRSKSDKNNEQEMFLEKRDDGGMSELVEFIGTEENGGTRDSDGTKKEGEISRMGEFSRYNGGGERAGISRMGRFK